uniref:Uncharacterized protein n=1 Tax=Rhizophora mucronata TaxID=61149 RepID=A0A2P2NND4_RHIMU
MKNVFLMTLLIKEWTVVLEFGQQSLNLNFLFRIHDCKLRLLCLVVLAICRTHSFT